MTKPSSQDRSQSDFQPDFTGETKLIHPAIGIMGEVAYVGIWLPGRTTETRFCLITSAGDIIPTHDNRTTTPWNLSCLSYPMASRWRLKDIEQFCLEIKNKTFKLKPVDVLDHDVARWKYYMQLPSEADYFYNALWDIGTYFHDIFNSYPYDFKGGLKRSGKTKALTLSSCISFNGMLTSNISESAVFRIVHQTKSTLLIDETERLANTHESEEYRKILLAGYKRGSVVIRTEKIEEEFVPTTFEVYGPRRLANISGLDYVLEDRVISTNMMRPTDRRIADREVDPKDEQWSDARCEHYRLYLTSWKQVKSSYEKLGELGATGTLVEFLKSQTHAVEDADWALLSARQLELWKPILALAWFFDLTNPSGRNILPLMIEMAVEHSFQNQTDNTIESPDQILVQVLLDMVEDKSWNDGYVSVSNIQFAMKGRYSEEKKWLSAEWVGHNLRKLGFGRGHDGKRRLSNGVEYCFTRKDVENLAQRLGIASQDSQITIHKAGDSWSFEDEGGSYV